MLRVPDASEQTMLEIILNKEEQEDLDLCLYVNDKTPAEGDTVADYDELEGDGYVAIELDAELWEVTRGDPTVAVYPAQEFEFDATLDDVYGYFLRQRDSGKLLWAERFSDGPRPAAATDPITVHPRITFE
jgi:hypothetical protein